MNFSDFSFWWYLALSLGVVSIVRLILGIVNLWRPAHDRQMLLGVSAFLFWKAARFGATVLIGEIIINYGVLWLARRSGNPRIHRVAVVGLVTFNLVLLAYFKYRNFFFHDVFSFMLPVGLVAASSIPGVVPVPPGLSFHTFQMIAFAIDSSKKFIPLPRLVDYSNFTSFFPQTVAGPIERHERIKKFEEFQFSMPADGFDIGMRYLSVGLFMKLVLSDTLAGYISLEETSNPYQIIASTLFFGLRIYFDFAGYSMIALGLARALGVELSLNFDAPYLSTSIQEFWQRWHITLGRWFRDYVYIPLGGSQRSVARNTLIVFALSGLWHGAGWNFIAWGVFHGILVAGQRFFSRWMSVPKFVGWVLTMIAVMFGWLLFMDTDSRRLVRKIAILFSPHAYRGASALASLPRAPVLRLELALVLFFSACVFAAEYLIARADGTVYRRPPPRWLAIAGFIGAIVLASKASVKFIYFAF